MGLTGRYIYVEFYVTNGKYFTLHFDVSIRGRDIPIRLTISNLYENYKVFLILIINHIYLGTIELIINTLPKDI